MISFYTNQFFLGKIDMKAENFGVFRNLKFDENKKGSSNETEENEQN